ncbi:MAG: metal-dependent hydrolase [Candidatus Methanomethylicia archaeon]|nr:metal-dependent hydrolase [Candidatus Methanomethylicia archaeon]
MKIRWLGHSGFEINIDGKHIVVDPFLKGNPKCKVRLEEISRTDIVAVTHAHFDHLGDSVELSKRDGSAFVCLYENRHFADEGGIEEVVALNIGGSCEVRGITVTCTNALHSGNPCGFVFRGKKESAYHAGDTGIFGDMALIRKLYAPDVVMIPIGGRYTMGPREAAEAIDLIRPNYVIPMHYNTFDAIKQNPEKFRDMVLKSSGCNVILLDEGGSVVV